MRSRAGVRLVPQGANTGLVGASVAPSEQPCVVLSTDRLRAPITIDVGDASGTVLAGTRLSALNGAAEPTASTCRSTSAPTRHRRHGGHQHRRQPGAAPRPMRHHVLGVEVVAADETRRCTGRLGGVRKDSRGHRPDAARDRLRRHARRDHACDRRPGRRARDAIETWWLAVDDPAVVVDC